MYTKYVSRFEVLKSNMQRTWRIRVRCYVVTYISRLYLNGTCSDKTKKPWFKYAFSVMNTSLKCSLCLQKCHSNKRNNCLHFYHSFYKCKYNNLVLELRGKRNKYVILEITRMLLVKNNSLNPFGFQTLFKIWCTT